MFVITIGIDEVGRGCWAGPLVAAAVVLNKPIEGLADSKLLSPQKREAFSELIQSEPNIYGLGWVWPADIDKYGITWSVKTAMKKALESITYTEADIVIDGNINYLKENFATRSLIKADACIPAVSAASIIAKVARDRYMRYIADKEFPLYGFSKHVGYGTKQHIDALDTYGVTSIHRKSYRPIIARLNLT